MPPWDVVVEVLLLRLGTSGGLQHRWVRGTVPAGSAPDDRAVALAGCSDGICHSTSWRLEPPGTLVLTYAALPDPDPAGARALEEPCLVTSGDPLRPAPVVLHAHHVVAHAVRHLVDLADRDPVVRRAELELPGLWQLLRGVAAATPTAEHSEAHALARAAARA